jgi:hypothetical protein
MHAQRFACIVDVHNIGMTEPGRRLGLAMEACQELGVMLKILGQHLKGHIALQRRLPGHIDHGHAAPPQFLNDLVRAQSPIDHALSPSPGPAWLPIAVGTLYQG